VKSITFLVAISGLSWPESPLPFCWLGFLLEPEALLCRLQTQNATPMQARMNGTVTLGIKMAIVSEPLEGLPTRSKGILN